MSEGVTFIGNTVGGVPMPDFITDDRGNVTRLDPGEADLLRQTMDWVDGRDR